MDTESRKLLWMWVDLVLTIFLAMNGTAIGCLADKSMAWQAQEVAWLVLVIVTTGWWILWVLLKPAAIKLSWLAGSLVWGLTFIGGVVFGQIAAHR